MVNAFKIGHPRATAPAEELWPGAPRAFIVIEFTFGVLFTIEVLLKMVGLRMAFIFDYWNWLDSIIIAFWLAVTVGRFEFLFDDWLWLIDPKDAHPAQAFLQTIAPMLT